MRSTVSDLLTSIVKDQVTPNFKTLQAEFICKIQTLILKNSEIHFSTKHLVNIFNTKRRKKRKKLSKKKKYGGEHINRVLLSTTSTNEPSYRGLMWS